MKALYAGNGTDGAPMDRAVAQIDPVPRVSIQVFCKSPDVAAIVSAAISDRRMTKAHIKLNMGGAQAAVEAYKSAPTPNVVVVEAPADRDALLEQLEELAQYCDAGTKVVVLGKLNDIVLYRQLIARGVSEYLVAPFDVVDFVQAMSKLFSVPGAKPLGRVIAVVGAKGGVGASTVAHNLAWSLASVTEMATIIADFDLAFGTAGLDYNQDPPQGIAEAVFAPERVDAVLVDRLLSKCGDHLSLLAAPATLDRVLDFAEGFLQFAARRDAGVYAVGRARRTASMVGLGPADPRRRGRGHRDRKPGPRQSSQCEKLDRQREERSASTTLRRGWS